MITPVNHQHTSDAQQVSQPPKPKPEQETRTPQNGELSSDQVTLRNASDVDHSE
jgi:hypothetical protein